MVQQRLNITLGHEIEKIDSLSFAVRIEGRYLGDDSEGELAAVEELAASSESSDNG